MMITVDSASFAYRPLLGRRRVIFEDLSWQVRAGEHTVLLGPNGAGKSTLLRLLAGVLRPRSGAIRFADGRGADRNVAVMFQDILALRGLTALEQVAYAGWLAGRGKSEAYTRAREALGTVRMQDQADQPTTQLSGGQLRRLGLAEALVRDSPVVLLDEPTAGLDPAQRELFREILNGPELKQRTVVVSTHQVDDLDRAFERVAVLGGTGLVFDGTVSEFLKLDQDASPERIFMQLVDGGDH